MDKIIDTNVIDQIANSFTDLPGQAQHLYDHLMVQLCTNGAICTFLEQDTVSTLFFSITLIVGFCALVVPIASWGQIKEWVKQGEGS